VQLEVKAALRGRARPLRDFPLPRHDHVARKALQQLLLGSISSFQAVLAAVGQAYVVTV
jgi:hypothetical protein